MRSLIAPFAISLVLSCVAFAQTPVAPDTEEREKMAMALLRETISDVANLRTVENRISFTSELAALMWYRDRREGRALFGSAVADFKALLVRYDHQMNALGPADKEESFSPMLFGDPSDRSRLMAKFQMALMVRQQIALSIAEHEPELAYNFFYDSSTSITNEQLQKLIEASNAGSEHRLIAAIAARDAARAAELVARSLDRGISPSMVEVLKQIHSSDPEKGKELGAAMLSKIKSANPEGLELWTLNSLIEAGESTLKASKAENGKPPIYTEGEIRELAEILAIAADSREKDEYGSMGEHIKRIEPYHPGRAAQLRTKFKLKAGESGRITYGMETVTAPPPPMPIGSGSGAGSEDADPEAEMMKSLAKLESGELPTEERDKLLAEARAIVAKATSREKKIMGLSMLGAYAKRAGDDKLANEVMREAEAIVPQNPKTYQDMLYVWALITGYAEVNPDRSFVLLEDTIFRVNGLIDAFVRIAEFIDVGEQMIVDGEFQLGGFGGGMMRQVTQMSGMADGTLSTLAAADPQKLQAAASRFERPEVRVLAKIFVLRQLTKTDEDDKDEAMLIEAVSSTTPN